jgi:hypothetical protein
VRQCPVLSVRLTGYGDESKVLCPRIYGQSTFPCNGACYSPAMYQCCDGQLQLLPPQTGPFKLEVHSYDPQLHGRIAHVCNHEFHVGDDARTCVYCFNAPPQYVCSTYQNQTVLLPSGAMVCEPVKDRVPRLTTMVGSLSMFLGASSGLSTPTTGGSALRWLEQERVQTEHLLARTSRVCPEPG